MPSHSSAISPCPDEEKLTDASDICIAFRRASRAVTHLYDLVLAPTGLRATQVVILQTIQEHRQIAQCRLACLQGMSVGSLSRRLAALRRAGLITVKIEKTGRHKRCYRLTELGKEKLEAAEPYWFRAQQRLDAIVSVEDRVHLLAAAVQVSQAATQAEMARQRNTGAAARPKVSFAKNQGAS